MMRVVLFALVALCVVSGCASAPVQQDVSYNIEADKAYSRGDFLEAARNQLLHARKLQIERDDSSSRRDGGIALCRAGHMLIKAGKFSDAEDAARRGLAIHQNSLKDHQPFDESTKFHCKMVIARAHAQQGDFETARSLGKEFLTLRETDLLRMYRLDTSIGRDDSWTLHHFAAFELAELLRDKEPRLAVEVWRHQLKFFYDGKASDLASEYTNLANDYSALGETASAATFLQRAEILKQVEHENDVSDSVRFAPKIAGEYRALGFSERAEFIERAADISKEVAKQEKEKEVQAAIKAAAKLQRDEQAKREAAAKEAYERQHPEIARAREAETAAKQKCDQCKSNCDSQILTCTTACYSKLNDPMCALRCQVTLDTCKTGCEQQRDALIARAGGTPLGTSNSGAAALFQGLVAVGDSLAAAKSLPSAGASGFAAAATPSTLPSSRSGNLAPQQSQSVSNGLPSSGPTGFSAAAPSPNVNSTHSCPTSLAHLAPQLPQYDVPDLQQARSAILQLSTTEMYQRMLASGITPANGAKMAIQDAQKIEQQREIAKQCVRQTAANPESVISSLEQGTYRSPNRAAGGVLDGCSQGYVLMHYQAVATKAAAVAIACMARP